jgi:hypothetical protein
MKKIILTLAISIGSLLGFSQDKGSIQISALDISSENVAINVSSPTLTYYAWDNIGFSLGIANFEDITIGTRYYIKDNNFAYASYGTHSQSADIGLGKTYNWKENVQIEPRLNFTDIINDERNVGLSMHLNFAF